jgi:hypothetical protein
MVRTKQDTAAIGLSVHTGWASCVVTAGTLRAPRMIHRERLEVFPGPNRFVFHLAEEQGIAVGQKTIAETRKVARANAVRAVREVLKRTQALGIAIAGCAIVAKPTAMPGPLAEILASHPKLHTAEGCFYRDALVHGAEACDLPAMIVSPTGIEEHASKAFREPEPEIAPLLALAGKIVGRPWSKDEKLASLGAWMILAAKR